jgi:hypothetical protein
MSNELTKYIIASLIYGSIGANYVIKNKILTNLSVFNVFKLFMVYGVSGATSFSLLNTHTL